MAEMKHGWVCPKDRCTNWEREIVPKCRAHHCTMVPAATQPADEAFRAMLEALKDIRRAALVCQRSGEKLDVMKIDNLTADVIAQAKELA